VNQEEWRPLFVRESGEQADFDILHEGIPRWLETSIWRWLMDRAAEGGPELVYRLERQLHIELVHEADRPLGRQHTNPQSLLERYWKASDERDQLSLLDWLLHDMQARGSAAIERDDMEQAERLVQGAHRLDTALHEGGSAWAAYVGSPQWGLVRRVNETTAELVKAVTLPDTDAARKIRSAWVACYRLHPNYDVAYRDAVLAVEAVSIPMTVRASPRASLGQVISHIRDTQSRWSVGRLDAKEIPSAELLLAMLKGLWHNQERHARPDGSIIAVTREEAEAAVSLAVPLVHWFTTGLVAKDVDRGTQPAR
jgi:hypothetical protein